MKNVQRPVQTAYGRMEDALERWSRHVGQPWHRDYLDAVDEAIAYLDDVLMRLKLQRHDLIEARQAYAARRPS